MSENIVVTGLGCKIEFCTTVDGTYVELGQLSGIDGIDSETVMFNSTGLKSVAGEQVPTLVKEGDFGFKYFFNPANTSHVGAAGMAGYQKAKTLLFWKITFPTPVGPGAATPATPYVYSFKAYVQKHGLTGFEVEGGVEAACVAAITGLASFSGGS